MLPLAWLRHQRARSVSMRVAAGAHDATRSRSQGSLLVEFSPLVPLPPPGAPLPPFLPPLVPPLPLPPPPLPAAPPASPCPEPSKVVSHPGASSNLSHTIQLPNTSFTLPPIPAAQNCTYVPDDEKLDYPFTGGAANVKAVLVRLVGLQPGSNVTLSTCDLQNPYGPDMDVAVYTGGERMHRVEHPIACVRSLFSQRARFGREGSARGHTCAV